MKNFLILSVLGSLFFSYNVFAGPGSATGKVTVYHLNSNATGRGACVQMIPAIKTDANKIWACLYQNNPLYKELNAMLMACRVTNYSCNIFWDSTDPGGLGIIYSGELLGPE